MMRPIKQGEHVVGVSHEGGFRDWKTVWNDGQNAKLRSIRDNPNVLFPGDELFLPDFLDRDEPSGTGLVHFFEAPALHLRLKVVLRDVNGDPIPNTDCLLVVEGTEKKLVTNGDGRIDEEIPADAKTGEIRIRGQVYHLDIGHLDPVDKKTGQRDRLANLGYYFGNGEEIDEEEFRSAVEEFQCDNGLDIDGVCGGNTQKILKKLHGC
jgi:hypothetical protein